MEHFIDYLDFVSHPNAFPLILLTFVPRLVDVVFYYPSLRFLRFREIDRNGQSFRAVARRSRIFLLRIVEPRFVIDVNDSHRFAVRSVHVSRLCMRLSSSFLIYVYTCTILSLSHLAFRFCILSRRFFDYTFTSRAFAFDRRGR